MLTVRFTRDFRGRASREEFYAADEVANLPGDVVQALLAEGAVEVLTDVEPEPEPKPEVKPKRRRKKAAGDDKLRDAG
jgi:hypothetical protein